MQMSLQGLQERLAALQETTTRLRELIERLATVDFQPGALPQEDTDDESSVTEKLSAEISQLLRGQLDEQELLAEELKFVGPEGPTKATLREGVERAGVELSGYAKPLGMTFLHVAITDPCAEQLSRAIPKGSPDREAKASAGAGHQTAAPHPVIYGPGIRTRCPRARR